MGSILRVSKIEILIYYFHSVNVYGSKYGFRKKTKLKIQAIMLIAIDQLFANPIQTKFNHVQSIRLKESKNILFSFFFLGLIERCQSNWIKWLN